MQERSAGGGTVTLEKLGKRFDDEVAVDGVDLQIAAGEFFALLGPSGCGKTTTLRMIGGFERPTSGRVLIDGEDVSDIPPEKRPVNTVFQSYALFPHLSVADNVGFGLRFAKVSKEEAKRQVGEALELVRLTAPGPAPSQPALGRSAAAGGPGPGTRPAAPGAAPRRAARRARCEVAQGPSRRAHVVAADGRHHVRVRHPRPGGGALHEPPPGRHAQRPHRAVRRSRERSTRLRPPRSWPSSSAWPTCSTSSSTGAGSAWCPGTRSGSTPASPRAWVASSCVRSGCACSTVRSTARSTPSKGWCGSRSTWAAQSQLEVVLADGALLQVVLPNDGRSVPAPGEPVTAALPPDAIQVLTG